MKIVFFGSSDFAVPSLVKLRQRYEIVAVVTKSDKPRGRGLLPRPSPVRSKAEGLGIPLLLADTFSPSEVVARLRGCGAELFAVVAYGDILPAEILNMPKLFAIGLHASLLPKYRGAAPINRAILNGERNTGVTVFRLDENMDSGDIILQRETEVLDSDDVRTLSARLSEVGAEVLSEAVNLIEGKGARFVKQDERQATYAPKLKKEDGAIDWSESAERIRNKVRAMQGWPGAFCRLGAHMLKIWQASVSDEEAQGRKVAGEIIKVERDGIFVACGKGVICVKELQAEGAKRMSVSDYLLGHKVAPGERFR